MEFVVAPLPPALACATAVQHVLSNLLSNAVKYSHNATRPRVEIGGEAAATKVTYYVRDNGVGFDPQYADKLFAPFERLRGTDAFEGSGMGLAICRKALERQGGRIWAESAPGEGATFFFSLPGA